MNNTIKGSRPKNWAFHILPQIMWTTISITKITKAD
jgi:hypothetical protein